MLEKKQAGLPRVESHLIDEINNFIIKQNKVFLLPKERESGPVEHIAIATFPKKYLYL